MGTPARSRRLRYTLVAVGATLLLGALFLFAYEPRYGGTLVQPATRTLVFSHRGFGDLGPDNSLYSVEKALDAGADGVDVDGQLTRDGELVIYHDLSIDRLTHGTGKVKDKTAAEMLALDLGPRYDSTLHGVMVHTFDDFVRTAKGRGILMVELKVPGLKRSGIEERAVEVIRKYEAHENVVLSSFNPFVLHRLKKLDARVRTALIFMDTNWNPELLAEIRPEDRVNLPWPLRQEWIRRAVRKMVKPDLLSINHEVDSAVTGRLIAKGWPVFIWTIDEESDLRAAFARRPYGVISDQPLRAMQVRGD